MHASATALRRPASGIRPEQLAPGIGLTHVGQGRISLHVTVVPREDNAAPAPAYSPHVGRWLSNDPIGISGGLNQYTAFGNNPVVFGDAFGLRFVVQGNRSFRAAVRRALRDVERALRNALKRASDDRSRECASTALKRFLELKSGPIDVTIGQSLTMRGNFYDGRFIGWDPSITVVNGENRPPFIGLAHEIGHAIQDVIKGFDMTDPSDEAWWSRQMDAVDFEDVARFGAGLEPRDRNAPREN